MGWDAPWHWVILAIIVIALFGYKKLPDASRALGRSLRIFKTEIKGMGEDDKERDARDRADSAPSAVVKPAIETPAQPKPIAPAAENAATTPSTGSPATKPESHPAE